MGLGLEVMFSSSKSQGDLNNALSSLAHDNEKLSQTWFETEFFHDIIHNLLLGRKLRFVIKCLSSFTLNFNEIMTFSGKLPTHLLS